MSQQPQSPWLDPLPTTPPLGVRVDAGGIDVALRSAVADAVELCLFDGDGRETRHRLNAGETGIWHGRLDGVAPGQRYGFRVYGPWSPSAGQRCNPAKLLLDPYAEQIAGEVRWDPAVYGHVAGDPDRPDETDSAPFVPRSLVTARDFDWGDDRPPGTDLADSVFYELHVRGFTRLHPGIPEPLRGTYAGLAHPEAIDHLRRLGVTAVELLPVQQLVHDAQLVARGLRNYWGYQTIGFFAPNGEYASVGDGGGQAREFKSMVRALHAAGIEVILDVVYNHTAEGGEDGPTLCFRGLDNAAYYRLQDDPRHYVDDTGTGNTLDAHRPDGLRLVMDSLRFWVQEMHVDGFRFDLAASLGRGERDFDGAGSFLDAVGQDPVLSRVKLIAEPWDIGSYEVGAFPIGWSEWNGRFRDVVRDFWRGVAGTLPELATRIAGSSDLYRHDGRGPTASVNLVTVHDGFTLLDLVSYDTRHNEANGEGDRDGTDDNRSWNCGVEGPTDDAGVLALRARQRRNLLATVLLAEGVPLLVAGDELGRTQGGNNNAYCQDDAVSWIDWAAAEHERDLTAFVAELLTLRRTHPVLRRRSFSQPVDGRGAAWFRPDGAPMTDADWEVPYARAVTLGLPLGDDADSPFLLLLNAWWESLAFVLPARAGARGWTVVFDTAAEAASPDALAPGETIELTGRSTVLLRGVDA